MRKLSFEELGQIFKQLETKELSVAHMQFIKPQKPPYFVWGRSQTNDLFADNKNHLNVMIMYAELYMDVHDEKLVKKVEKLFKQEELAYELISDIYIGKEKLHMIRWSFYIIGG